MKPWQALALVGIGLLTQAATITITNDNLPRSQPPASERRPAAVPDDGAKLWLGTINRQRALKQLPPVALDPGLCEAARRQADFIARLPQAERQTVPARKLLDVYWQAGATEGNPSWRVFSQDAASPLGPWPTYRIGPTLESDLSHIGIGSVVRAGARWTVVVMVKRRVELAGAITGVRQPFERLYLRGRLLPPFEHPKLMLTKPDGTVRELALQTSAGLFELLFELDGGKGRYMVEIMVDSQWGPAVASLFPIDVGTAYHPVVRAATQDGTLSLAERRQRMLALINADRARFQLPPVALNEALTRMAQGHSDDMKAHGFFAHVSPTAGTLEDRAKAAGIPPMSLGENIAISASLAEAEDGLMASPAHRAMILDPLMTVVGIGIASHEANEPGPAKVWVTQNYAVRDPGRPAD